jgi:hypothetical protein
MISRLDDHELQGHPDTAVRIWHEALEGEKPSSIARWLRLDRGVVDAALAAEPPNIIRDDLRRLSGLRGFWIAQDTQRGGAQLRDAAGVPHPFLVILVPHRITLGAEQRGLRAVRREIRAAGNAGFDFGTACERVPLWALMATARRRDMPVWEIDAKGAARPYDGRHFALLDAGRTPEEDPSPAP